MPIEKELLKEITCCLNNDDPHFVIEPVLLKCSGNACRKCLTELSDTRIIKCLNCGHAHEKKEIINSPINTLAETIINLRINDIFQYLDNKLTILTESLKGKSIFNIKY